MPRQHDKQTVDAGLLALIVHGTPARAKQALEAQGLDEVPDQATLYRWRIRHADRMAELHRQHGPALDELLVNQTRELALNAHEAASYAVNNARKQLEDDEVRDAAAAARNLSTVAAIAIDKNRLMQDKPTTITGQAPADEILKRLARNPAFNIVEGTAEEIDAQRSAEGPLTQGSAKTNAPELEPPTTS